MPAEPVPPFDSATAETLTRSLEEAAGRLNGADGEASLAYLRRMNDEIAGLFDWHVANDAADQAVRLGAALWRFWQAEGAFDTGRRLLQQALEAESRAASRHRVEALYGAGVLAFRQGDNAACRALTGESLALAREIGDERGAAMALIGLCRAALRDQDRAELQSLANRSLEISQRIGDAQLRGYGFHMFAESAHMAGDLGEAEAMYGRSLETSRQLGDTAMVQTELYNLGQLARHMGKNDLARQRLLDGLSMALDANDSISMAYCLAGIAAVLAEIDPARAARFLGAARGEFERRNQVPDPADAADFAATGEALRDALGEAEFGKRAGAGHAQAIATVAAEVLSLQLD